MKGVLIDTRLCTGCQRCVNACCEEHALGAEIPAHKLSPDGLSGQRLVTVIEEQPGHYVKMQCMHCLEPGCVEACPVGAIEHTPEGPVVYDSSRCIGCRYCMLACPLGIPRYEWEQQIPYMKKCDMCVDRLRNGHPPACVEVCPHKACIFGEREELLKEARRRIDSDGGYQDHIWGEFELGGTAVLYITDIPLTAIPWPANVGSLSIPGFTWPVISKTPWLAGGTAALLLGVWWVIQRRMDMQAGPAESNPAENEESSSTQEHGDES